MGCGKSKDADEGQSVTYKAKPTGIPECDSFFQKFEPIVTQIDDIRKKVQDSRDKAIQISGALRLKDEKSRFPQSVQVLLWAVSAAHEGHIQTARPQTDPSFSIDTTRCPDQTKELNTHVTDYMATAQTAKDKVEALGKEIQALMPEAQEAVNKVKEATKDKPLKEKAEAIQAATSNSAALSGISAKLQKLLPTLVSAGEDYRTLHAELKTWITKADEVGAEAAKAKELTPVVIFTKYNKGEKLPEAAAGAPADKK